MAGPPLSAVMSDTKSHSVDLLRSHDFQSLCTGLHGASRGINIVYQQDGSRSLRQISRHKGLLQVLKPFFLIQFLLRQSLLHPPQSVGADRDPQLFPYVVSEKLRLVKTPLSLSGRMNGNSDNDDGGGPSDDPAVAETDCLAVESQIFSSAFVFDGCHGTSGRIVKIGRASCRERV